MSILVVTPDADAAQSLCSALVRSGQKATWAESQEQAEQRLRLESPLVLVADTELDAHAHLVRELRAGSPWARVLLIGEGRAAQELDLPVVSKPFDASEVAALLAREGQLATLERSRHDLHERIEGLTLLVDECFEAIVGLSGEGRILSWNPGAESLYGYSAEQIIGQSLAILDVDPGALRARLERIEPRTREVRRRHKSGREILVMASVSRMARARAGGIELSEVSLDLTERQQLERGLEHAERLAAIGRIAAGMAHEINNPLAVIRASAAYVSEIAQRSTESELADCASDIELAVERIGSFVAHVCGFARRERPQMADASLQTAIDIALRMVRPRVKDKKVELTAEPCPSLHVPHDPPRLAQAVLNVLSNAVDAAAAGGGHVTLRARPTPTSMLIEVEDDGPGLSRELAATAFEPFKTTKPFGQGTGLGLAITRQIATDHRGRVTLESRAGGGARVVFELPRFSANAYHLLVIDRDPAVRRALATDLRREGFDVSTAGTFAAAREHLRQHPIHVILTDWQLPDRMGADLVAHLTRTAPAARVVVTSADPAVMPCEGVEQVVSKPWDREQLSQLVRSLCLKGERQSQRPPAG